MGGADALASMLQGQAPGAPQMTPAGQQQPEKPVPNNRIRSAIRKKKGIARKGMLK